MNASVSMNPISFQEPALATLGVAEVRVRFVEPGGSVHNLVARTGTTLMQAAVDGLLPGIVAECGGQLACATCHVYLDPAWQARVKPPSEEEQAMLEGVLDPGEGSRLCCQVVLEPALDGLSVRIPERQY